MNATRVLVGFLGLGGGLLVLGATACGGMTQPLGDVAGAPSNGGTTNQGAGASNGGVFSNDDACATSGAPPSCAGRNASGVHPCETECLQRIRAGSAASCKLCHTSRATAMGGLQSSALDLESPNITPRLKDVPAKHLDIPPFMPVMCPTGDLLIDSANPQNSWLLKKVKGQQGNCGTQMPQPPTGLRADELACIETYVFCVAGQTPP
jgi:hypothetical protein